MARLNSGDALSCFKADLRPPFPLVSCPDVSLRNSLSSEKVQEFDSARLTPHHTRAGLIIIAHKLADFVWALVSMTVGIVCRALYQYVVRLHSFSRTDATLCQLYSPQVFM